MAIDYVMPKLAMAMNEGSISQWIVTDGQKVERGAPLMVVETEKVAYDLESPETGFVHIVVPQGTTVPVETVIAKFAKDEAELALLKAAASSAAAAAQPVPQAAATSAATASAPAVVAATAPTTRMGRVHASPLARKLASDAKLDIATIAGTGPNGRIVKRDIVAAMQRSALGAATSPIAIKGRVPLKGMRGAIARATVQGLQTAAQLSQMSEIDATKLLAARALMLDHEEEYGTRVSVLAFYVKALANAARVVPIANASVVGDEIVLWDDIHVGIAVALPGESEWDSGLIVPVIRHADRKGLVQIDKEIKDLVARARSGQLKPEETQGGTVTVSSTAGLAEAFATTTPLLNGAQAVIIQPGNIVEKAVVRDGQIVARSMLSFSLTFDHRIMDGVPFTKFYNRIHQCIENPELMLA